MTEARATLFLALLIISIPLYILVVTYEASHRTENYLPQGSLDLKKHRISHQRLTDRNQVFFLGSSAVSGINIPPETTISDYFHKIDSQYQSFNLATMQASVIESTIYYLLGLKYTKPSFVIYGVNPDNFPSAPGSPVIWYHRQMIEGVFSKSLLELIDKERIKRADFSTPLTLLLLQISKTSISTPILVFRNHLRYQIFGPLLEKSLFRLNANYLSEALLSDNLAVQALNNFHQLCKKNGTPLILYFEPILHSEVAFGPGNYKKFREIISYKLNEFGIPYFDYTYLLPQDHRFFIDYIHLTPKGNQRVAQQLASDLKGLVNGKL